MKVRLTTFLDHTCMYSYHLLEGLLVLEGFFRRVFKMFVSKRIVNYFYRAKYFLNIFARDISLHRFRNLMKYIYRPSLKQNVFLKMLLIKLLRSKVFKNDNFYVHYNLLKDKIRMPTTKLHSMRT